MAGLVAGWSEPTERRELRVLDRATGWRGWVRACLPWQWPTLVGAALAVAVLGMHEIEATVLLLVPGRANLAQQILGYLHFSRTEELSAAAVQLMAVGVAVAAAASALMNRRRSAS
jgi:ABC-type Fe3+ transport system permease subunit